MPKAALALVLVATVTIVVAIFLLAQEPDLSTMTPLERGAYLVEERHGCRACHQAGNVLRAPLLGPATGQEIDLIDGAKVVHDEAYLRRAILAANSEVRLGYQAIMPSYEGVMSDSEIDDVIVYLQSLQKN